MDTVVFKPCKDPFKRILLAETDIGIAVSVFYAYDMVADDSYSGAVSGKLLVGGLGVILACLDKPKSVIRISLCRKAARNPLFCPK